MLDFLIMVAVAFLLLAMLESILERKSCSSSTLARRTGVVIVKPLLNGDEFELEGFVSGELPALLTLVWRSESWEERRLLLAPLLVAPLLLAVDMVSLQPLLPDKSRLVLLASMTGTLSTRPGHRPSFVHNLLASFKSWTVILNLSARPCMVSPGSTVCSTNEVHRAELAEHVPYERRPAL